MPTRVFSEKTPFTLSSIGNEAMLALVFRFPVGRYHATPWGRNVNEADVAWPPEPWRLLRALIAAYWRKCDRERWPEKYLSDLIDTLAETLPVYQLPEGAIHAHTRHYMPIGTLDKGREKTSLVFDAFVKLPERGKIVAAWRDATLNDDLFAFACDLAASIGYLGRAESWSECEALAKWDEEGKFNCGPADLGFVGDPVRLLAPLTPESYEAERRRLIESARKRIQMSAKPPSPKKLESAVEKAFQSRISGADTVPERLVDALTLDTADYQDRGWNRPAAAREVVYAREHEVTAGVKSRGYARRKVVDRGSSPLPTVARFLLVGRPRPRIENAVKIGELMRSATLAQFRWRSDSENGRKIPKAPRQISGHNPDGTRLKDPLHAHAFWLPEDADSDGLIDHVSVYIATGIDEHVRTMLNRITRLWIPPKHRAEEIAAEDASALEWRLALEGFGQTSDFADGTHLFGTSAKWQSVTPFLAAGYLKFSGNKANDHERRSRAYAAEVRRLLKRRGTDTRFGFKVADISVRELIETPTDGINLRAIHFHRFRSRGREIQRDASGALLEITFPKFVEGPLALGYGSHFGLGLFRRASEPHG